jgi:hypothetical protein
MGKVCDHANMQHSLLQPFVLNPGGRPLSGDMGICGALNTEAGGGLAIADETAGLAMVGRPLKMLPT